MMPRTMTLAAVVLAASTALVAGCAAEDAEAGEAAYPGPIGYTPPGQAAAPQPPAPPASPAPPPQAGPPPQSEASEGEVPIGGPDEPSEDTDGYGDTDPSALSDFHSTLDPYGTWQDDPTYGNVWVPSPSAVGPDFTPYVSAGHWAYDDDYAWVSDYEWGWAPFHYGRCVYAGGPGWEWIPGRTYAGAWVSWRYGLNDWAYVGWAPLPPTWCWRGGVAVGLGFVPRAPYAFVGTGELFSPAVGGRVIAGPQVGTIAAHTQPYVPASPTVGGRVTARPTVGGPPPSDLHIAPSVVASANVNRHGLTQARAFSRPTTAMAMGARAPEGMAMRSSSQGTTFRPYAAPSASHFGGRLLGGGFAGSAASAPPMHAPSYSLGGQGARPYYGGAPRYSAPASRYASPGATFRSVPSYRAPAVSGGGGYHGAPASGGYHMSGGGGYHGSGGGYHGGGGGHGGRR